MTKINILSINTYIMLIYRYTVSIVFSFLSLDLFYIYCCLSKCFLFPSPTGTCLWPGVQSEGRTSPLSLKTQRTSHQVRQGRRPRERECVFLDRKDFESFFFFFIYSVLVHHYIHLELAINVMILKGQVDQSVPAPV